MIDAIWDKMCRVGIDKLWHFIGFREFTSCLLRHTTLWIVAIWFIVITLAIGKEIYDWWKGEGVDPFDLLADGLGILIAFIN